MTNETNWQSEAVRLKMKCDQLERSNHDLMGKLEKSVDDYEKSMHRVAQLELDTGRLQGEIKDEANNYSYVRDQGLEYLISALGVDPDGDEAEPYLYVQFLRNFTDQCVKPNGIKWVDDDDAPGYMIEKLEVVINRAKQLNNGRPIFGAPSANFIPVEELLSNSPIDENAVLKFLKIADDLIDEYPFLYVELARTRTTDWMAWLRKKPDGELIANGEGLSADEACADALNQIPQSELVDVIDKEPTV